MSASQHVSTAIKPRAPIASLDPDQASREELEFHLPEAYHKILDYHVAEILLSTIALAVIVFLSFHLHH